MASSIIDQPLETYWKQQGIEPNPVCDDATFLRRVSLDLAGRIPTAEELTAFTNQPDRAGKIDALLAADTFSIHWANLWTAMLNGYGNAYDSDREALRIWLVDQFKANHNYVEMVTELVSATGSSAGNGAVNFLARYPESAEVKVSRLFLGVQIDCARCHDHPYDRWTESDFGNFSRFFDSVERDELGEGNIVLNHQFPGGQKPRFLTGATPRTRMWRDELALFMPHTNAFSKNFVNRIWYQLLGRGIVHDPDNFHAKNPPAVPELLDTLTQFGIESEWSFRRVIREICQSSAYQRSSHSNPDQDHTEATKSFAIKPVKPLTPEQWYTSVSQVSANSLPFSLPQFLEGIFGENNDGNFSDTWEYRETVQQLMNRLALDLPLQFESLEAAYATIAGRSMTSEDYAICEGHSISDVSFALLNSSEFFFNH